MLFSTVRRHSTHGMLRVAISNNCSSVSGVVSRVNEISLTLRLQSKTADAVPFGVECH